MNRENAPGGRLNVTYVITFSVIPTQRERFLKLLGDVLDAMRHEPMFVNAALHVAGSPAQAALSTGLA
jgi:quinol monooxygenase YgiN